MELRSEDLFAVLSRFNPWWTSSAPVDVHAWRRTAFTELSRWLFTPPAARAVLISGARQVGKTTLLRQAARELLSRGVPPGQVLYASFDHPLIKLAGLERTLRVWRDMRPPAHDDEYLLLDEIQYGSDWRTWLKHEVDFQPKHRIVVTGSALPLRGDKGESGVGRWHTIKLPTLSFHEYLQIRSTAQPSIEPLNSLTVLFRWSKSQRQRTVEAARPLVAHFHEYLLRGGFPQTARVDNIVEAQRLLREDVVDKALRRDMTAYFGVRLVVELEKLFLYFCLHDGGTVDVPTLARNLGVSGQTVNNFIDVLESSHLIYRLRPFGYGKEVLRAKQKVYLADAAIAGSVMLKGNELLRDSKSLGAAVETALFKHLFTRYYQVAVGFSYWQGKRQQEVDVIGELGEHLIPFEVKHESQVDVHKLKGLREFCAEKASRVKRAYVITKDIDDFECMDLDQAKVLKLPVALACYWLSGSASSGTTE